MSSSKRGKYDLTKGGILNKLLLVAVPVIGTQLLQMSYNLTDIFLLGRVGSGAVAAAGTAGLFMWLCNGLMLLGRMGAEIGVSQEMGRGDEEMARRYSHCSLALGVTVGLLFASTCFVLSDELISLFRLNSAKVESDASLYLSIVAAAMPFMFVNAAIVGTFNGSGNTRVPFFVNMAGLLLNAALDPIFIFVLGFGVTGAAVATMIAQMTVAFMLVWCLVRYSGRPFERYVFRERPSLSMIWRILRWSVPVSLESCLFCTFTMIISRLVASFGVGGIAIYRVGSHIESLSWLTCVGFSTALTSFVGQNFGAGEWGRIRGCVRVAYRIAAAWGTIVTTIFIVWGDELFAFFLPERELIEGGGRFLFILSFCQIFGCFEAASSGAFRGLGRTAPPSIASITCNMLRVPVAWALSTTPLGLNGVWIGMTIGAAMRGIIITPWFVRSFSRCGGAGDSSAA